MTATNMCNSIPKTRERALLFFIAIILRNICKKKNSLIKIYNLVYHYNLHVKKLVFPVNRKTIWLNQCSCFKMLAKMIKAVINQSQLIRYDKQFIPFFKIIIVTAVPEIIPPHQSILHLVIITKLY